MKIYSISFTHNGDMINLILKEHLNAEAYGSISGLKKNTAGLSEWSKRAFANGDAIVFIGAAGIAVRAIAPFVRRKETDPAIIVIDDKGNHAIPILSGHIGGANELSEKIANLIGAEPVITTSTDINGVWAADTWARNHGCVIENIGCVKNISSALLRGENIGFASDYSIKGAMPDGIILGEKFENGVLVSHNINKNPFRKTLHIMPKNLYIGVGSCKNAPETALKRLLDSTGFSEEAVQAVCTINIKRNEPSVSYLCRKLGCSLKLYSADELNTAKGNFISSQFVKNVTGTDNVCERAAVLASGGHLLIHKTRGCKVTLAVAESKWEVEF